MVPKGAVDPAQKGIQERGGLPEELNRVENEGSSGKRKCAEVGAEQKGYQKRARYGKTQKESRHNCDVSKKLSGVRELEKLDEDLRGGMKVHLHGFMKYSFIEAAKKYQETYYPDAEGSYAFPAGYVLNTEVKSLPYLSGRKDTQEKVIRPADAVAKVFNWMRTILADFPSLVLCDYDFTRTFGKSLDEFHPQVVEQGDHDVCSIALIGSLVLALFFEIKSRKQTSGKPEFTGHVGEAEGQLEKSERIFRKFVGATAVPHTYVCSFVAMPYLWRRDVAKSLECCHENILTMDDLESRDAFREFLEKHGIPLTSQNGPDQSAKECYLDVMRTYLAASASVNGMPRTVRDLRKNIDERMQTVLELLTPHQKKILLEDRSILFLAGGQGTGKTYLLRRRAQQLAERGETVIVVNMSDGELTRCIREWPESREFREKITIMDSSEFLGSSQVGIDSILERINAKKLSHVLIDEMQINLGLDKMEPDLIGGRWKNFSNKVECQSVWIVWRPSDVSYPETLDIHRVIQSLGQEKVELLTEIKRNTKELGEFVTEVSRFIQKSFRCMYYLPMRGLEYGLDQLEEKRNAMVVFINAPPIHNWAYRWASEAAIAIRSWMPDSLPLTIITRAAFERNVLVRELGDRLGQEVVFIDSEGRLRGHSEPGFLVFYEEQVVFIDSEGRLRGHSEPGFLVFYEEQVTGMSFKDLILFDDNQCYYTSWSLVVAMAQRSLHVITTNPLPSSHWEEIAQLGLITSCSLRTPGLTSLDVSEDPPDNSLHAQISWNTFLEQDSFPSPDHEMEDKKFELLFGPRLSGKTTFLVNRLKRKYVHENEKIRKVKDMAFKARIMFVDCSIWNRNENLKSLSLVAMKERIKRTGLENVVEVLDIHDLLEKYELWRHSSLSPRVIEKLLVKMLENEEEEGRRLHIAFDNAPVYPIGEPGDTEGLREEWESIFGSLSSRFPNSLASLTIAFQPYIRYATTTFDVKEFFMGFQSPPGTEARVVVQKGCRDVGFPRLLHHVLSHESPKELRVKPGTLNTRPQPSSLVFGEKPILITSPSDGHYHGKWKCIGGRGRGCVAVTAAAYFHSQELGDVVVLISDGEIQVTFTEALKLMKIASGVNQGEVPRIYHPREYRGCESSQVMCVGIEDSWVVEGISRAIRTLFIVDGGTSSVAQSRMRLWMEMDRRGLLHRTQSSFHALDPSRSKKEEDARRVVCPSAGLQRIFAMARGQDLRAGMWEVHPSQTLWVNSPGGVGDVYLRNSLFLLGSETNPREGLQLDLASEKWATLSPMKDRRSNAASVILDPHTILVLGGQDFEAEKQVSSCEYLDVRTGQWSSFQDIPLPLSGLAATVYHDHLYISGGWDGLESRREVWRCRMKGGQWEELPCLKNPRGHHGMMGNGKGGLSVIGGLFQRGSQYEEVLETETYTLDVRGGWVNQGTIPFDKVWKATDMNVPISGFDRGSSSEEFLFLVSEDVKIFQFVVILLFERNRSFPNPQNKMIH
ncbi:unnamed protein product [Darwinula stevensoni]|uniref:Uncharacterized protein n=1 Tax=Darwinula stevensoni TaxID=69355 RepID=A0A7R9A3X8_9CRUS|nr:unnamed protein product [Darwinula stevensoni]CAG0888877.1 unnamed protein product [Darwinula stevensoni]